MSERVTERRVKGRRERDKRREWAGRGGGCEECVADGQLVSW